MNTKGRVYPLYETTKMRDFRDMTENVAKKYPDDIAFSFKKNPRDEEIVRLTYTQVKNDVRDFGTEVRNLGMNGKTAVLIGQNSYEWCCIYLAAIAMGVVLVPIDRECVSADLANIINSADCEYVFYGSDVKEKIFALKDELKTVKKYIAFSDDEDADDTFAQIKERGGKSFAEGNNIYYDAEIDPEKLSAIVFTSGTTGNSKGVMLSQKGMCIDMTNGMYNFAITRKTVNVLPLHHTFGSTINLIGHFGQGSGIYLSSGLRYITTELQNEKPGHLIVVPLFVESFYKKIIHSAEKSGKLAGMKILIKVSNFLRLFRIDLRRKFFKDIHKVFGGNLSLIISGGAAMNQKIIDFFDGIGVTILNGYGITECSPLISCNRNEHQEKGSVGIPILDEEVKIANPDENGEGEICVKGPNVMLGYFNNPEATKAAFDEDGFFRTGDYGRIDKHGWIYITGRVKNMIILSNGKNVYPEEIEKEIQGISGVGEVVVYAGESDNRANRDVIVAEIFPDEETLKMHNITDYQKYFETEIIKINHRMPPYKRVDRVKIREAEFEKNTSKKIMRFKIKKDI